MASSEVVDLGIGLSNQGLSFSPANAQLAKRIRSIVLKMRRIINLLEVATPSKIVFFAQG